MSCRLAILTSSLGRASAGYTVEQKLKTAKKHGYEGIEIHYEDVVDLALRRFSESSEVVPSQDSQLAAARSIHKLCESLGLEVVCLQPFTHLEGLRDRKEHVRQMELLSFWFQLAHELHTDLIAIASSYLPSEDLTDDMSIIVSDMREAADAAAKQSIRLSLESLCWGTRLTTWEDSYRVVNQVDRPNFGLCLDTFNIAGYVYADPAVPDGKTPAAEEAIHKSVQRLATQLDVAKVFYVQVADAERLTEPLVPGHKYYNQQQPMRMSWSRNCRLFYGEAEEGAYLPIKEITEAFIIKLGYQGWLSMEIYNRRLAEHGDIPDEFAHRGQVAWQKLQNDIFVQA